MVEDPKIQDTSDSHVSEQPPKPKNRPISSDSFSKVASGISALAATAGLLVGGIWTYARFSVLLEQPIAEATAKAKASEARKTAAEATTAERIAERTIVVNIDLATSTARDPVSSGAWWVTVEISIKNTGNSDVTLDLEKDTRFYIARITDASKTGELDYEAKRYLAFDYPDRRLTWFTLRPGAELDKYRTVQIVRKPGMYIARFSIEAPSVGGKKGREYSAQSFFVIR